MTGRAGRWTLGLYNSYDANSFHEAMRRAVARAAPLCHAFGLNLAPIGFPFHAYRDKDGAAPERETPVVLARLLAESTSIGEGGEYLERLAAEGRFQPTPFPGRGFPPQLGTVVLATRRPDPKKRADLRDLAFRSREGESFLFLVGLGPRGVPKSVHEQAGLHLDLTGSEKSLETATAMGVLVGRLHEAMEGVERPLNRGLTTDALVLRGDRVLLIRRARDPFRGRYALPGGFMESAETAEACCLRELREETGLEGRVVRLLGVYSRPGRDPRGATVSLLFLVDAPSGEPRASDDAAEARFFPLDALPALAFDHDQMLAEHAPAPSGKQQP